MQSKPSKGLASAAEYYLRHPDKLSTLEPKLLKLFWAQRHWNPMIRMNWVSGIISDGEGTLTFPDGATFEYEMPNHRP